jgi:Asp-tRNA(Asn)/Glu-tRNA(Gln) amidotransferase A subunit family amidase
MAQDLTQLTGAQAVRAMAQGRISVEAYARACLDRIALRDPDVRAWSVVNRDQVIAQARTLDASGPQGPLHGLPIGVKDVILTRDLPTQYNSPIYEGFSPGVDAACVQILRAAGALILGKTHTVEFAATGRPAPTRNPHNLGHTPGGSSSGSGAAVGDRQVPAALGTQTGGWSAPRAPSGSPSRWTRSAGSAARPRI